MVSSRFRSEIVQLTAVIPDCRITATCSGVGIDLVVEKRATERIHHDRRFCRVPRFQTRWRYVREGRQTDAAQQRGGGKF
jgi:hypothetical protein